VNLRPTASLTSANQNQDAAILTGSVTAQGASTTVVFQYSTDAGFGSFSTATAAQSPVTGFSATTVTAFISGLANGTTYYYRIVATNSIGSTTTASSSFKTWGLIQYANGTPGTYSLSIPVGAGVAPTLRYVFLFGGGGGSGYSGGGGGGYRLRDTYAFSSTNGAMTVVVGSPGGAQAGGSASYIQGTSLTQLLGGGGGGGSPAQGAAGASVGSGDNPGYGGGGGQAYVDKNGNITAWANGGGGGISGGGGEATAFPFNGGNGGPGGSAYGWVGGAGGGGYGTDASGGNGSSHGWGSGGSGVNVAGTNGLVTFYYYGAV
jgi:hypothetical protein